MSHLVPDSATRLRHFRRRVGLTQAELAQQTGLSRQTVARLEAGTVSPHRDTSWRLATFFGFDPGRLFGPAVDPSVVTDFRQVDADELAEILRDAYDAGRTVEWSVPSLDTARELELPLDYFFEQRAKALVSLGRALAELERRRWVILVDYGSGASVSAETSVKLDVLALPAKEKDA